MKQISKILTLGILFLFVCTLQLSAQKCKFDINKTDPISGEVVKENSLVVVKMWGSSVPGFNIGFNRTGESYYTHIHMIYGGQNLRAIINKGDIITIKLSNGEILTVYSQEEVLPNAITFVNGVNTEYKAKYDIDAASLQKIADNPPTFIRINIGNVVYDKEIDVKNGNKIADAARCILQ
jgi:glycine/serine hydroxymethyltransferase